MLIANKIFRHVGPKAIISTTMIKKCGVKTSTCGQEHYIPKTCLKLLYTKMTTIERQLAGQRP